MYTITDTKRLIMTMLLISIFGCFAKKEKMNDLPTWLEKNFPGQLVIVGNIVDLDPRNLFYHQKSTILSAKEDPEVQLVVKWSKEEEGLGLNKEEVASMLEQSKKDVAAARMLLKALQSNGLEKCAVGVIEMAAYIMTFEEPTPETRERYASLVLSTINELPNHDQTSIWIECMEPSVQGEHFKDIIPFGYWRRGDSYHDRNKIMSLDFEWNADLKPEHLSPHWTFNDKSDRTLVNSPKAYEQAAAWAGKNLKGTFYLEPQQMIRVGLDDDDPLTVRFEFPYFESKPDTTDSGSFQDALGYVSVAYHTDHKTFSGIKKLDE